MKKLLSLLIIFISVFAFNVSASDIDIVSVDVDNKTHFVDQLNDPVINENEINYNLKFSDYQQYIVYKVNLKNNTSHDYNYELILNESNIIYELLEDDGIINANSSKDVLLKINYKSQIDENLYQEDKYNIKDKLQLVLTGPEADGIIEQVKGVIEDIKENPKTGRFFSYVLVLVFIISGTIIYLKVRKNTVFKYNVLLLLLLLPMIVYAAKTKTITIDINLDIEVNKPTLAVFRNGWDVNSMMRSLATSNPIVAFKRSYDRPDSGLEVQSDEVRYDNPITKSDFVITMWYSLDDHTIYFYTDAIRVSYPAASNDFYKNLTDLQEVDNTIRADAMMYSDSMFNNASINLESVSLDISGWTLKSYRSIYNTFDHFGSNTKNIYINADDWTFYDNNIYDTDKDINYVFKFLAENDERGKTESIVIDANNWTVYGSTTRMKNIFYRVGKYASNVEINAENWDLPDLNSIEELFYLTSDDVIDNLTLNLSGLKAPNATSAFKLFWNTGYGDSNAVNSENKTLNVEMDLSDWDISSMQTLDYAFIGVSEYGKGIIIKGLESWDVSNVTTMQEMFQYTGCYATNVEISDISNWDVSNVNNFYQTFEYTGSTANELILDLSNWDTSGATNIGSMFSSFGKYAKYIDLNVSNFDFSNVTSTNGTLFNNIGEQADTLIFKADSLILNSNASFGSSFSSLGGNANDVDISISNIKMYNQSNFLNSIGYNANNVNLNISNWDMRDVTSQNVLGSALSKANNLKIDMSNWKINQNTKIENLLTYFGNLNVVYDLDVSDWDLGDTTSLYKLFYGIGKQAHSAKLDLSGWDTSNITDMSNMFESAFGDRWVIITYNGYTGPTTYTYYEGEVEPTVEIIGLGDLDVSNVTDMYSMFKNSFRYFDSLSLDLSSWNTSSVTSLNYMFSSFGSYMNSISLDVSGWNTSNVTAASSVFYDFGSNTSNVQLIGNDGWDLSNVSN